MKTCQIKCRFSCKSHCPKIASYAVISLSLSLRVVVAILDQFHFTVSSNAAAPLPDGSIIIEDTTDTNKPIDTNEEEEKMEDEEDKKDKDISRHIYKAIVSIILPSLQSVLTLQVRNSLYI